MDSSALVFLDDLAARKLAAAWPLLGECRDTATWAKVAGVSKWEAERIVDSLRQSGICLDDGTTNAVALKFVASKAIEAGKLMRKVKS
jgi:hypothetical protein